MVQIIDETPGIGALFAQGIGKGLSGESKGNLVQQFTQMIQQKEAKQSQLADMARANQSLKENYGIDLAGITNPEERKILLSEALKGKTAESKKAEEEAPIEQAFDTLNRMKEIRKKGNLGVFSFPIGSISSETRKDRGEYSQLGKSLISMASNIPIRNRQEFETLAHGLYDPNTTDAEAEGILDAMERILRGTETGKKMKGKEQKAGKMSLQEIFG